MAKCEFAGCGNAAVVAVPTLDRPSPVPSSHPDYHSPHTVLQVCAEHEALALARAAALEIEVLRGGLDKP